MLGTQVVLRIGLGAVALTGAVAFTGVVEAAAMARTTRPPPGRRIRRRQPSNGTRG